MSPQPLDLLKVLDRFQADRSTPTYEQCLQAFRQMSQGKVLESHNRARAAVRDSLLRNDYGDRAIACATLAAVSASQGNFEEAIHQAEDCYRIYHQSQDEHNEAVALALLATIYQMHLERLSQDVTLPLIEARARSKSIEANALSKGEVEDAAKYRRQFIEFGEHVRRARWIPAIPHALPLVWLPIVDRIAPDLETQSAEPIGYMEPLLFVLKTVDEAEREASPDTDTGSIVDLIYTARPLPPVHGAEPDRPLPARLKPNAIYAAVKVDPETAHVAHLEPDDYLLVRNFTPEERDKLVEQSDVSFRFQMNERGLVEVMKPIPAKFVGEEASMLEVKVDAVLRRVP